jgi:Mg-chelatase subunit ChlI
MEIQVLTEPQRKKEMLPEVVDRIFAVCKTDPHFKLKSEMKIVEQKLQLLKNKIAKQESLLAQSNELTETVRRRISLIQQENETRQTELLENLGSEL